MTVRKGPQPKPTTMPEQGVVPGLSMADLGIADGLGPADRPRLEPRPAALLMYHPERWCVSEGQVVPLLGRMPLIAGVGGVKQARGGKINLDLARASSTKRGWTILPPDCEGPGTSYLHSPMPGVYLTRWETAHAGSSVVSFDGPGYAAWLRRLMASGRIPPPPPYVLERLRARIRQETLVLQDQVRTVPSVQVELDRRLSDLTAVERELDAVSLSPIPQRPAGLDLEE